MMKSKTQNTKKPFQWKMLVEGRMKWVTLPALCVLLAGACWWGYEKVTVMAPVEASKATVDDVVQFLGNERGFVQMSVGDRYDYLDRTWKYYAQATPEQQQRAMQALQRMTPGQREQFGEAVAGVIREKVREKAIEYNRIKSASERSRFIQQAYSDMNRTRTELTGGSSKAPGFDATKVFRGMGGETPGAIEKTILDHSTGSERAQAEPFVNKMIEYHKSSVQVSR